MALGYPVDLLIEHSLQNKSEFVKKIDTYLNSRNMVAVEWKIVLKLYQFYKIKFNS